MAHLALLTSLINEELIGVSNHTMRNKMQSAKDGNTDGGRTEISDPQHLDIDTVRSPLIGCMSKTLRENRLVFHQHNTG